MMIHTKSLIQRLDCIPWLLAACFALVWAGSAQAQAVGQGGQLGVEVAGSDRFKLELDVVEVNEGALGAGGSHQDQTSVPIKVTATRLKADGVTAMTDDEAKAAGVVTRISLAANPDSGGVITITDRTAVNTPTRLTRPPTLSAVAAEATWDPDGDGALTRVIQARYIIDMPMLVIPKDKAKAEVTVRFYPNDDGAMGADEIDGGRGVGTTNDITGDDLRIWITGDDDPNDGANASAVRPAYFMLRDNDRANAAITFTFDKVSLSKEADRMAINVTASLDAKPTTSALTFSFKDVADGRLAPIPDPTVDDEGWEALGALSDSTKIASRDAFYRGSDFGDIVIAANKMSASKTFHIDPINVDKARLGLADTWIALGSETTLTDIRIVPGFIKLTDEGLPRVDSLTEISPPVYEDGGDNQEAKVRVTLKEAAPAGGTIVSVTIKEVSGAGTRDTEYEAEVEESRLEIPEGDKSGVVTIFVSPEDNETKNTWQFEVHVDTGDVTEEKVETIDIVDDEGDIGRIEMRAEPLEISEIGGEQPVMITAHVIGKAASVAVDIPLTTTGGGATREIDYRASYRTLTIPAGAIIGMQEITITPVADEKDDGDGKPADETVLVGTTTVDDITADDGTDRIVIIGDKKIAVHHAEVTIKDEKTPPDDPADEVEVPDIAFDVDVGAISGTAGVELEVELAEATTADEDAEVTYLLSGDLPAGLSFDAATRTVSGTPTAGDAEVTLYATDGTNAASLVYTITIADEPTPEVNLDGISASHTSVRENDGQATNITLTVTLAKAAAVDEKVTLGIVTPTEGTAAQRDEDFDATLDGTITIAKGSTSGTAQLTLTPKDNTTADGHKAFGVQATSSSGHQAQVDIGISDNESGSSGIVLSVDPDEVNEGSTTQVIVTASLDGKAGEADVTVDIGISSDSSADRDVDYSADFDPRARITISAGSISGTTAVSIAAVSDDDAEEGDETIILTGSADDLGMGSAAITLKDGEMMEDDMEDDGEEEMDDGEEEMDDGEEEMMVFAFAGEVADQAYTAGAAITALVLPEATGGAEGDVSYSIFGLPAGLAFDDSTRTISGTPEAATAGAVEVTVLATDSAGAAAVLSFNITVNPALSFGDLFGAAAGKANPASDHGDADFSVIVGQELNLPLPEVTGGTPPLTYSVTGLPSGLLFDPETRMVSGTPEAITADPVEVTYIVTDANGQTVGLPILVAVIPPPLAAPPSLLFEAYTGADGQGVQGGFVLLTWGLSEHHAGIDGYRIYRELPVLGNEMVPWAFADAVPEVEVGRAIVAMLDGVQTSWGIAAERGSQTTSIVSGNQAGKRVPMVAGLNADARMYLAARTALPSVGEDLILDVGVADFAAVKGYGLQVQYDASKLEFVEVRTDQPLAGRALATPQVLADEAGILTVAAYGDVVSDGEVALSLVFRPTTEIENTVVEIIDSQTYDSEVGFNRLALPLPVQVQTRPAAFALANNYPNPFNPATTIKYALPQAADVELTVYNVVGQPVRTLVAEHQSAGRYVVEWDATNDSGHSLSSGMYFYHLEAGGDYRKVKKMLLLK